jgi:hypothetical protein
MQLSEIDRKIIANVHSLPLNEQHALLEYSKLLKNRIKNNKKNLENKTSFGVNLKAFLEKYESDPIDIDTSIFDSYRKSVTERGFRWED